MNHAREMLNNRICPSCGENLEETPCVDAPDRVWVSCKGYPYCPTRLVVDRIGEVMDLRGQLTKMMKRIHSWR